VVGARKSADDREEEDVMPIYRRKINGEQVRIEGEGFPGMLEAWGRSLAIVRERKRQNAWEGEPWLR
jgi:hypothetical protein